MIISSSTSVSIKKGVVKEIGAATPIGKEKVKKDAGKKFEAEEGVEGTKAG